MKDINIMKKIMKIYQFTQSIKKDKSIKKVIRKNKRKNKRSQKKKKDKSPLKEFKKSINKYFTV